MEVKIEPTSQHVTWILKDFLELPQKDDSYLDSPEFDLYGDTYCLRLFPEVNRSFGIQTEFHVRRLKVNFPKREVSCKIGIRWRESTGDDYYYYTPRALEENYSHPRSCFEENRQDYVPDGRLTIVCSMHLRKESRARSSAQVDQGGFPGHDTPFSSRWSPPNMELSAESPCTHVHLTVPKFFDLTRETCDSLTSPEFSFAGDTYCFRFCPNDDTDDYDLQLVRLTFSIPERTISYRVGYLGDLHYIYTKNSRSLVGSTGFCITRSELEKERDNYAWDGTSRLKLFLRLGERSSAGAGTSGEVQKRTGLSGIRKLQSDYRQLLQKGTESDACVVVSGKEFQVHKNVLRARSTVFEAMFGHDTAEKESGRVVVDDLDSDTFGDFLEYLYTGDVHAGLSDDNVFGLYEVADKYDASTLKSECVEHMRRTLSVDSFCDVVTLALLHSEEELLRHAISFFKDNLPRIIITSKWQQFNIDNAASVNEFFIKTFVPVTQRDPRSPDLPVCTVNTVSEPVFFTISLPF